MAVLVPSLPSEVVTKVLTRSVQDRLAARIIGLSTGAILGPEVIAVAAVAYLPEALAIATKRAIGSITKDDKEGVLSVVLAWAAVDSVLDTDPVLATILPEKELLRFQLYLAIFRKRWPQTGHTVQMRVSKGKRGRPKKGEESPVKQYLRIS